MWYFTNMVLMLFLFLGSSYSTVSSLSLNAGDAQLETPLSQDAERLADVYRQALVGNQQPLAPRLPCPPARLCSCSALMGPSWIDVDA